MTFTTMRLFATLALIASVTGMRRPQGRDTYRRNRSSDQHREGKRDYVGIVRIPDTNVSFPLRESRNSKLTIIRRCEVSCPCNVLPTDFYDELRMVLFPRGENPLDKWNKNMEQELYLNTNKAIWEDIFGKRTEYRSWSEKNEYDHYEKWKLLYYYNLMKPQKTKFTRKYAEIRGLRISGKFKINLETKAITISQTRRTWKLCDEGTYQYSPPSEDDSEDGDEDTEDEDEQAEAKRRAGRTILRDLIVVTLIVLGLYLGKAAWWYYL